MALTAVAALAGLAALAAATPPVVAPYKPGATLEPGWTWECVWTHDVSTVQVFKLGLAGDVPLKQKNEGQHASAEACEQWCCENKHLKIGPPVSSGNEGITTDESTPPCDFWQWADIKTGANNGCWVAPLGFSSPNTAGAKPDWIGAQGCTRPLADWGAVFLAVFLSGGALYLIGGAAYMRSTGQRGWIPHPFFWQEIAGLVEDGMALTRGSSRGGYGRVGSGQRQKGRESGKKKNSSKGRFAGGRSSGEY